MNNNTTLTQAVKAIHEVSPMMSVKDILEAIQINHNHLQVDYRKVYNTLKRVSGGTTKAPKTSKAPKVEKSSIIFDLTLEPAHTVKGVVVKRGQHCK